MTILIQIKSGLKQRPLPGLKTHIIIIIKRSIRQENIIIPKSYVPNNHTSRYFKQKLMVVKIDAHKIITAGFNSPTSVIGRASRKETRKETEG